MNKLSLLILLTLLVSSNAVGREEIEIIYHKPKVTRKIKEIRRTKIIRKVKVVEKQKKNDFKIGAIVGYGPRGLKQINTNDEQIVDINKGALYGGRIQGTFNSLGIGINALNNSTVTLDLSISFGN